MAADVVNLRMARKRLARAERERLAAENRVRHGARKSERREAEHDRGALDAHLDAHQLAPHDPDPKR